MLSDKEKSRIKAIEEILYRNKTGNYAVAPLRLIAYIIVVFGDQRIIHLSYKDEWIKLNFTRISYMRSVSFLKLKDILQRKVSGKDVYKVNFKYLKNIIVDALDIEALLEIDSFFKFRKKKLKVKRLKEKSSQTDSSANFSLYRYNRPDGTKRNTSKLDVDVDVRKVDVKKKESLDSMIKTNVQSKSASIKSLSKLKSLIRQRSGKPRKSLRKDSTELYGQFKFNPSENPKLCSWKSREIEKWRSIDFLGYYICLYKEETELENISLQNDQAYSKVKHMIRDMLKRWFNGNKKMMYDYLKWSVHYFTHEMDGRYSPSIGTLLNPYKQTHWVYDLFVKNKSKKGKRSKDNKWASEKTWR